MLLPRSASVLGLASSPSRYWMSARRQTTLPGMLNDASVGKRTKNVLRFNGLFESTTYVLSKNLKKIILGSIDESSFGVHCKDT